MIRSLLKRTKFHRAALPLLAMLLTTTSAWAETEAVTYIKADGTSGTQEAIILTGNENQFGSSDGTTWYVVKNTQEGVDVAYTKPKTLYGTVNIILEDGAEMTATSGGTTIWGVDGSTLNIYGQTNGTGRLSSESTAYQAIGINGDINIYGGVISASATESKMKQAILANNASVNIYGGTVTATSSSGIAIQASTAVNIYGGAVTATGYQGISAGSITLGWTNHDDYIKANSYEATNGITIADGKTFYDGTGSSYASGTATANSIAGKTLRTYDYRTVSFNSNGGSAVDEQIIAVNSKATEPTAPTREGYTFVRWLKDGASYDFSSNVTANIALTATWATEVAYIDATGTSGTHKATILTGSETTLPAGWYVVNSDITYTGTVTFNGNATIILADNCTMNVGTSENRISGIGISCINDADLIIYGQTLDDAQAGCLNVYSVSNSTQDYASIYVSGNYTQHSGSVYINHSGYDGAGICAQNLTLNGGRLNVNSAEKSAINLGWDITINGGKLDAIGNSQRYGIICSNGGMTLGYTNASDYIHVSKYNAGNRNITIAPGRKLTDDTNVYRGVLSSTQISALANQTLTPKGWEGDGSVTTPYQITDSDDLLLLAFNVNQGNTYEDKYFKLKGDITFDYAGLGETESNFTNIGCYTDDYYYHYFKGHFDGCSHKISGIRLYSANKSRKGLFGTLGQGAVVENLTLTDSRITGHDYTGGIVGENIGGTITNCHVDNTVYIHAAQKGACYHGGIAGGIYSNKEDGIVSTISKCTSKVQLTVFDGIDLNPNSSNPTTNYGGIVGANMTGTLVDNYVEGATIPQVTRTYGAIEGYNDDLNNLKNRNYYKECNIAGVARQTNMACGDPNVNGGIDVTYRLMSNGKKIGDADALTLQISGTGAMADFYFSDDRPWDDVRSNITEVVISDGVTTIGKNAFLDCANLASIKISSDVKTIGERAFMHCWALTDVTIPASVESIGDQAFADCETLKTIHMKNPDAPTLVADFRGFNYNFNACNALEGILTPSAEAMNNYASAESWRAYKNKLGIEGYCGDASVDGGKNVTWMMTQNGTVTVDIYKQENDNLVKIDEVDVPAFKLTISGTGAIANYADINDTPWMAVSGQETDASQPATFYKDKKFITALEIGAGVTDLGTNAINGLRMLKSLTIADGSHLTTIAFDDFRACKLTKITLPETVTQINLNNDPNNLYYAINNKAWRQYRSLFTDVKGTCGKTSGDNLTWALTAGSEPDTDGCYPLTLTISGTGAMADYDNQNQRAPWGTFASVLSLPEGLTHIGEYAFSNNSLTTVAIPASVETIGGSAFEYCGLSSVTFTENCKLTILGSGVFDHCHSLSSIVIPASIVTLGSAFRYCSSLASVTFAENSALTTISETFRECTTLETIYIPATVTKIGFSSFIGCSALKTVRLNRYDTSDTEHPLTTLGKSDENNYDQFAGCPVLRGILVPEGAQSAYQQDATWVAAGYTSMIYDAKKTLYTANTTNQWMTWCSDIEYFKPENCTVYTVSGVNSEQVQVAEVEGVVIPAYTPVLIKRAEGTLESDLKVDFSDAKKPSKENGWNISSTWYTLCDNNGITPTYGYNSISYNNDNGVLQADAKYNNNYSIFFYGNTGAVKDANTTGNIDQYEANYVLYGDKLMLVDTDNGIPVNRCVLKVSYKPGGAVCSRSLTIGVGGDTTGMEELKNEKIEELNSEWYDLQGRKLGSKPTRKGLYINNGKKIVIK